MKKIIFLLASSLIGASASASCYTVLGPKGEVLSESPNAPVDMSRPLHQTLPERFGPGASLVFGLADGNCGSRTDRYVFPTKTAFVDESRQQARPGKRAPKQDRQ